MDLLTLPVTKSYGPGIGKKQRNCHIGFTVDEPIPAGEVAEVKIDILPVRWYPEAWNDKHRSKRETPGQVTVSECTDDRDFWVYPYQPVRIGCNCFF